MRLHHVIIMLVVSSLVACPSPEPGPALTSGIWRSTEIYDPGQGQTTAAITTQIFELSFANNAVTGWRYGCDQSWINCAPKGYGLALTGTVSKGAADFEFSFKPLSNGSTKVQITGTFSSAGFVGRFKRTDPGASKPQVGDLTMTWLQSQR